MIYLVLFYEFFKTGLFSIGGGLATLPFLYDMSTRTGWFSVNDIANMVAISQSTPGPLGINMAAYTGYMVGGVAGSFVAAAGLIAPSLIIIVIIAHFLEKFKESKWVKAIFYGLKPASYALITVAWISVVRIAFSLQGELAEQGRLISRLILAAVLFFILRKWKVHPILVIVFAVLAGVFIRF